MPHADLIFEAVRYHRHVGASLDAVRAYAGVREKSTHTPEEDRAALDRLAADGQVTRVGENWFLTPEAYRQAKGSARAPSWLPEDAWLLLAVLYQRKGSPCRLADVLAAADYINHAIPTLAEVHGALNRLAAAGLIAARRETFTATPKAVQLFAKVEAAGKKRALDQLDGLGRIMACPCCGVTLKSVRWRIAIDAAAWQRACAAYANRSRT